MASYPAPTEALPVFAPAVFNTNDVPLTIEEGSKFFITYPAAQGAITIPTLTSGTINVSGTVNITNTSTKATVYGYETSIPSGTGEHNTAFGYRAGKTFSTLTTTGGNSAYGALSLQAIGVGATNNTAIGHNSLYGLTSGTNNTFVGTAQQTGNLTTTESNNTTLGYDAKCSVGVSGSTAIGVSALASVNNSITLGRVDTDIVRLNTITPIYATLPTALQDIANLTTSPTTIGGKYYVVGTSMTIASATASTLFTFSNIGIGVWHFNLNLELIGGASTTATIILLIGGVKKASGNPAVINTAGTPGSMSYVYANTTAGGTAAIQMSNTGHTFTGVASFSSATLTRIA